MAKIFTSDGVYIAKSVKDHLNTWEKKPADILLEDFEKEAPSMMLQQLAAAEKKRVYVNGSYIGVWNFAVYIRIDAEDTASRLDATGCLQELAEWLSEKDDEGNYVRLPPLGDNRIATNIEMTASPAVAARYENGVEDYQAVFSLEYKSNRR